MHQSTRSDLLVRELGSVYRFARHLCEDGGEAEDLVEDTYRRALNCTDGFEIAGLRPRIRLLQILHEKVCTRHPFQPCERCAAKHAEDARAVPFDMTAGNFFDRESLASGDLDDPLKEALDALPRPVRAIVFLWAVEELTYGEIAEITNVSIDTVTIRLGRARDDLVARIVDRSLVK